MIDDPILHMIEDLVPMEESAGLLASAQEAINGDFVHPEKYLCHITTLLKIIGNIHSLAFQYQEAMHFQSGRNTNASIAASQVSPDSTIS